jgi:hypothetical protein
MIFFICKKLWHFYITYTYPFTVPETYTYTYRDINNTWTALELPGLEPGVV